MTTHLDDDRLDAALRDLDAAAHPLTSEESARRDALLTSLLATAPEHGDTVVPLQRPRRRVLRWAIPAAAAAALVGVMTMTGGPGGGEAAYASWTPGPSAVDAETRATAESACRDSLAESLQRMSGADAASTPTSTAEAYRTVAAERRGTFLLVAMAAADGSTQTCFFDAGRPDRVEGAGGGVATAASTPPAALAPNAIEATGPGMQSGPEGTYAFTQGRVGRDVTGVTVHSEERTVSATVSDGWFAAWWPATPIEPNAVSPTVTYDVTLRDGSTRTGLRDMVAGPELRPTQIGGISRGGGTGENGMVTTVSGHAGADVASVTVHGGPSPVTSTVRNGVFSVEIPADDSDLHPTYDVTLTDGRILRDQAPVD